MPRHLGGRLAYRLLVHLRLHLAAQELPCLLDALAVFLLALLEELDEVVVSGLLCVLYVALVLIVGLQREVMKAANGFGDETSRQSALARMWSW